MSAIRPDKTRFLLGAITVFAVAVSVALHDARAQSYKPGNWHEKMGQMALNVAIPFRIMEGKTAPVSVSGEISEVLLRTPVAFAREANLGNDVIIEWEGDKLGLPGWDALKGALVFEEAPNRYIDPNRRRRESRETGYIERVSDEDLSAGRWVYCGIAEGTWHRYQTELPVCLEDQDGDSKFEKAYVVAFNGPHSLSIFQIGHLKGAKVEAGYSIRHNTGSRFGALLAISKDTRPGASTQELILGTADEYFLTFGIGLKKLKRIEPESGIGKVPAPRLAYTVNRKIPLNQEIQTTVLGGKINLLVTDEDIVRLDLPDGLSGGAFVYRRGACIAGTSQDFLGCETLVDKN